MNEKELVKGLLESIYPKCCVCKNLTPATKMGNVHGSIILGGEIYVCDNHDAEKYGNYSYRYRDEPSAPFIREAYKYLGVNNESL